VENIPPKGHDSAPDMFQIKETMNPREQLPRWMKEYWDWHASITITAENKHNYKYLVIRCATVDDKCGGTADRLGILPAALVLAQRTHRLLYIYWSRPCALQEFLKPHQTNWTLPMVLQKTVEHRTRPDIVNAHHMEHYYQNIHANNTILILRYQSTGKDFYNEHAVDKSHYDNVYRPLFFHLFEPARHVAEPLARTLVSKGYQPFQYTAVHIRALYHRNRQQAAAQLVQEATKCVQGPFLIVSDSQTIASRTLAHAPLHLDRGSSFLQQNADQTVHDPAEYVDTFVDAYLLAYSQCIHVDKGGFAAWASLLMQKPCVIRDCQQTTV